MTHPPFITLPGFSFAGLSYGFFTRQGGVSQNLYQSLNCGLGSKDDPAHVHENRRRVAAEMEVAPTHLISCRQIHSSTVVSVDAPWEPEARPQADAIVTRARGLALGILTADCGPVLFHDPDAGVIAAAHAGWRGARDGILEATLDAMAKSGAAVDAIHAIIGPCIQQKSYEVSPDFPFDFLAQDEANSSFFVPAARASHFLFDLPGYIERRLVWAGVRVVHRVGLNTYNDPKQFFSYRRATHRNEVATGSLISVITLRGD